MEKIYDEKLAEEAEFANADYRLYAHDLAINPRMFELYQRPVHKWHNVQLVPCC